MASSAEKFDSYDPAAAPPDGTGPIGYLAIVLAWVVPGLGHFLIGQWKRGLIFMITIHTLFGLGMVIGGIRVINPPDQAIWTYTQFLSGWPMLAANKIEKASRVELGDHAYPPGSPEFKGQLELQYEREDTLGPPPPPDETPEQHLAREQARTIKFIADHPVFANHPKIQDLGAVYCGIAGMLNLLVMFDVLLRVTGSVREDPVEARKRARQKAVADSQPPATGLAPGGNP